jgi:hypothetical protein
MSVKFKMFKKFITTKLMDNNRGASIENGWKQKVVEQVISFRSKPAILDGCRITFFNLAGTKV